MYTALSVASMTNLLDEGLAKGAAEWIAACQTYEGGIGATPGEEAHGGYTFCGLAAVVLLGRTELLRLPQLTSWLVDRQMGMHGGFQGRTNKLVDGCYSFWQVTSGVAGRRPRVAGAGAPPSRVAVFTRPHGPAPSSHLPPRASLPCPERLPSHGSLHTDPFTRIPAHGSLHADPITRIPSHGRRSLPLNASHPTGPSPDPCPSHPCIPSHPGAQGGAFPLLSAALADRAELPSGGIASLFSTDGLLDYLLVCCQMPYGGLRDKPGRGRDYYHTCYCLSGLAVAAAEAEPAPSAGVAPTVAPSDWKAIGVINPVYNVSAVKAEAALSYFRQLPPPGSTPSVA